MQPIKCHLSNLNLNKISICKHMLLLQTYHKDFELLSFWLSNTYQMLNCLKQYSGEEVWIHFIYPPWCFSDLII